MRIDFQPDAIDSDDLARGNGGTRTHIWIKQHSLGGHQHPAEKSEELLGFQGRVIADVFLQDRSLRSEAEQMRKAEKGRKRPEEGEKGRK